MSSAITYLLSQNGPFCKFFVLYVYFNYHTLVLLLTFHFVIRTFTVLCVYPVSLDC